MRSATPSFSKIAKTERILQDLWVFFEVSGNFTPILQDPEIDLFHGDLEVFKIVKKSDRIFDKCLLSFFPIHNNSMYKKSDRGVGQVVLE